MGAVAAHADEQAMPRPVAKGQGHLEGPQIPETDKAVVASSEQTLAVGRESKRPGAVVLIRQQRARPIARLFRKGRTDRDVGGFGQLFQGSSGNGPGLIGKEQPRIRLSLEQFVHFAAQVWIGAAGLRKELRPLFRIDDLQGFGADVLNGNCGAASSREFIWRLEPRSVPVVSERMNEAEASSRASGDEPFASASHLASLLSAPAPPLSSGHPEGLPIPDHELLCPMGSGAYGEVWLARNLVGTLRAVKIVRRDRHDSAESFEREFKGLKKFEPVSRTHEGLVDVLTLGLLPGGAGFYYVMELADDSNAACGPPYATLDRRRAIPVPQAAVPTPRSYSPRTLRTELKSRGALPASEVIALGLKLTAALAHLHAQGLVHRDVKPSNILFVGGEPKLADAGLVAAMDDARSLVGTAGYIAPEGPGTPSADLYALGKVLYEMMTGCDRNQFPGLPIDLATGGERDALAELNTIVVRACQMDSRERYTDADGMRADLEYLRRGKSVRRRRRQQRCWRACRRIGMTVVLIGLIGGAAMLARSQLKRSSSLSSDPQAVILYEQAKGLFNQHTLDSELRAYRYLAEAVGRDPKFLDAYYLMFETYFTPSGDQFPPYTNRMANFQWVAEKMRMLDTRSAQYHTAMAWIRYNEWKWDEEIEHLQLALRADRSFLRAHGFYGGVLLRARGDPEAALRAFRAAERSAPFDSIIQMHLGTPYYVAGDYTKAIAQFQKALELEPRAGGPAWFLGLAHEAKGDYREALQWFEKHERAVMGANAAEVGRRYEGWRAVLAEKGPRGLWQAMLENHQRWWPDSYALAGLHARLGNTNDALSLLEKAFQEHHPDMPDLLVDQYWRTLDGQPRFQRIVAQMGFKPKPRAAQVHLP